jgi:predicted ATPase
MNLTPGTRLGSHEILAPLGAGGMGEVYLAHDTRLDRRVALKLLPARMARDPDAIARFRHEALALASLNHPNIATVYGFEEVPDGPRALVMEHVDGRTLSERLGEGALAVDEALRLLTQVAAALEAAHERGVVHRDIKPGNLMLGPRGLVKVLDFGLARRASVREVIGGAPARPAGPARHPEAPGPPPGPDDATIVLSPAAATDATIALPGRPDSGAAGESSSSGMVVGTPGYMSPEQVRAEAVDGRTDIFALGCVLFECVTGCRAFAGADAASVLRATLEREPEASAWPAAVPEGVRQLVARCLRKDPRDRPATMREVRIALEDAQGVHRADSRREGPAAGARHRLPAMATRFVGRETIVGQCQAALAASRLLALVGMGGSGKTRIALALAERSLPSLPAGAWFVDVAPLGEAGRVVEALAATLEVADEAGRTLLDGITSKLATGPALVLLDNCETLPEACGALAAELLRRCPDVRVLATSRVPLGVAEESVYTVPAMEVPPAGVTRADDVADLESVRLFVERATAAAPAFELTDANAGAVAEVCRRLDGIPLALELAAARVRLLGIEQIRARLDDRFKLLARGGAGADRQQTVIATLQWSWDHLHAPEQELMRRLAVFAGGWTLELACAVCAPGEDEFEVLDLLTRLVERALVVVDHGSGATVRYRFLESVWRFARDRLEEHGEAAEIQDRHLEVFVGLAEMAGPELAAGDVPRAMARIRPEEDNLLAALAWCAHAPSGPRLALRVLSAAYRYWLLGGRYVLLLRLLREALAREGAQGGTPERAEVLARAAGLSLTIGEPGPVASFLEESLAICRSLGDRRGVARALAGLAVTDLLASSLASAAERTRESRELYRELGQVRGVAMAEHNLSSIAYQQGSYVEALEWSEAAVASLRETGDLSTLALALSGMCGVLLKLGRPAEALAPLREAIDGLGELESPRDLGYVLDSLGHWLADTGRDREAATAAAAAGAIRRSHALALTSAEEAEARSLHERLASRLGAAAFAEATAEGEALDAAAATRWAKRVLSGPATA